MMPISNPHRRVRTCFLFLLAVCSIAVRAVAGGADLDAARKLLSTGKYAEAVRAAEKGSLDQEYDEEWRVLLAKARLVRGDYTEACMVVSNALPRFSASLQLRLVAYDVFRQSGFGGRAREILSELNYLGTSRSWAYRDPANMAALGRAALLMGNDPKKVLDVLLEPARKAAPDTLDTHLAVGQLALDKQDYALAARTFEDALKRFPKEPEILFGLAKAYAPSDRRIMVRLLNAVTEVNPGHVPAVLQMADHLIDGEEYAAAEEMLKSVEAVNPRQPEVWAYRAILAHLRGDLLGEETARSKALSVWTNNPAVDHLIGRKLSQKYRFAEGAEHQRQALAFEPGHAAARLQLAQDLLRLGKDEEGWKLVEAAYEADAYDVTAYNLTTLRDTLKEYTTLTNAHFIVRMLPKEAEVYGGRVMELVEKARTQLTAKYGLTLDGQVTLEIYGNQKDFGVRTFGMPENPGFLGVCFGRVITANSPSAQSGRFNNWEAVLWHEFCHVVTLEITRNRMPRWLSEGISVFEERQSNPSWGQAMNPRYREIILGGGLTPVGALSGAFLNAKTPEHIQFAYFESSLVVEFLVERHGMEKLKSVLKDLAGGRPINDALAQHTEPLADLDKHFAEFAKKKASELAPGLDWTKPEKSDSPLAQIDWVMLNPKNYYRLTQEARQLIREKKWAEAKVPLSKL
ncbi:MAG TPA: tetratricopeptide repeat protein, partial [Roseimicrobium sp.]|nr:tetratricopeptide repeat protein [Roseimicrobium sp.]